MGGIKQNMMYKSLKCKDQLEFIFMYTPKGIFSEFGMEILGLFD